MEFLAFMIIKKKIGDTNSGAALLSQVNIYFPTSYYSRPRKNSKCLFCLLSVSVLWYYFACRLFKAEKPQKRRDSCHNQWISLSIFLKDITTKTADGPVMSTTGMKPSTTLFHMILLLGVCIAFTTTEKSKYDRLNKHYRMIRDWLDIWSNNKMLWFSSWKINEKYCKYVTFFL